MAAHRVASAAETPRRQAVLLLHGFTSTPASLEPVRRGVEEAGIRVLCPLLPGHGSSWQDLARIRAEDLLAAASQAAARLLRDADELFIAGCSMGGALAVCTAAEHRAAGVSLINPALKLPRSQGIAARVLHPVLPTVAAIAGDIAREGVREEAYARTPVRGVVELHRLTAITRRRIPELAANATPVTLMLSEQDHVLGRQSANVLRTGLSSEQLHQVVLRRSYHMATLDHDQDLITEHILRQLA